MNSDWKSQLLSSRSSKNLSLEECSEQTKIPINFLSSLEEGDLKALPDSVYTEFHIKKYFSFLEVSSESCLNDLKLNLTKKISKEEEIKDDEKINYFKLLGKSNYFFIGMFALALTFMTLIFFLRNDKDYSKDNNQILENIETLEITSNDKEQDFEDIVKDDFLDESGSKDKKKLNDGIEASTLIKPIEVIPDKIKIIVSGESWIIIEDKFNKNLIYELMENEEQEVLGYRPLIFKIGNPEATKIIINNKRINISKISKKDANYSYIEII